jgi:Flp pilus assembly protein TadD
MSLELLEQAEQAVAESRFEDALTLALQAREIAPSDTSVLDMLADVYIELGDTNQAKLALTEGLRFDKTCDRILALAALSEGQEALMLFNSAAEKLAAEAASVEVIARNF